MKKQYICVILLSVGMVVNSFAVGTYYEFSAYGGSGSEYDVASYANTIYWGGGTDVHSVDVSIADNSKKDEPKNLVGPDGIYGTADDVPNPNYQTRTFSNEQAITLSGSPKSLNSASTGEMYVDSSYIYTIATDASIIAFNKATGAYVSSMNYVSGLPATKGWGYTTLLSYGGGKWWMGGEYRGVYSSSDGSNWTYEFTWDDMTGGHGDGMEYVNGHLFVSDMTSNYIAMWDKSGTWSETDRFSYLEESGGTTKDVEGMGFGALGHFWAGSGYYIYELGGGEIGEYTDGQIPAPGAILLAGMGTGLVSWLRRRRMV